MLCLFCDSEGPFTIEHIIPESMGNNDLLLSNQVCKKCNHHFSQIENQILQKSPFAFWRVFLGIKSKRGKLPSVDLSQPKRQKGKLPNYHNRHDDGIGFTAHEDSSTSVDIFDGNIINDIKAGNKTRFQFVLTPQMLMTMGRFLCKVGVELASFENPELARSADFRAARRFARFGEFQGLWPIFYFQEGTLKELRRIRETENGLVEEVDCYKCSLLQVGLRYVLVRLGVGTDNWVLSLTDPFPTPEIRQAFPDRELSLIWYPLEQI